MFGLYLEYIKRLRPSHRASDPCAPPQNVGPSWGFRVQVGGLGGPSGIHFGSCRGLGGQEAPGKEFGRAWVGPRAAGDPEMGPT